MEQEIGLIRYVRTNILKITEGLSTEQLNHVPQKFNNSIAWNMAHLIVTLQSLNYRLGGLATQIDDAWFAAFVPGTRPERDLSADEIVMVKAMLISTLDQFDQDYKDSLFTNYTSWAIPAGTVQGVEEACRITCVHEGRHWGVITSLVKLVS